MKRIIKYIITVMLSVAACHAVAGNLNEFFEQSAGDIRKAVFTFADQGFYASSGTKRAPSDWVPGTTHTITVYQVIDADTLRGRGKTGVADVRLHGVEAPEWNQPCKDANGKQFICGQSATEQMVDILKATAVPCPSARMHGTCVKGGLPVECTVLDLDRRWGRPVAKCVAGRKDVAKELISRGYARAKYAHDYVPLAATARFTKRGLWAGTFPDPAEFRHNR